MEAVVGLTPSLSGTALSVGTRTEGGSGAGGGRLASIRCCGRSRCVGITLGLGGEKDGGGSEA
jgi:hypothetical protein